jgi:ribonuclease HI
MQRKLAIRIINMPENHPLRTLCPPTFPPYYNTDEPDRRWTAWDAAPDQTHKPRYQTRLIRILSKLSTFINSRSEIETWSTIATPPWHEPTIETAISKLPKEEEALRHGEMIVTLRQDPNNILVYTDGSKREDNIGGAGHIDIPGQDPIELLFPLGREHEVYDAEIHAIHKTIEKCAKLCRQRQMRNKTFWVFSDNQAAVMRMATFKASTGQTASLEVQQACKTISEYDCRISLQWVPGHTEVEGNEEADRLAKAATEIPQPSLYMTTVTYLRRIARACSQIEWAKEWRNLSNTGRSYAQTWKRKPDAIFESNNRKTISLITQLRTAHGYFRAYLAPLPNNQIETES